MEIAKAIGGFFGNAFAMGTQPVAPAATPATYTREQTTAKDNLIGLAQRVAAGTAGNEQEIRSAVTAELAPLNGAAFPWELVAKPGYNDWAKTPQKVLGLVEYGLPLTPEAAKHILTVANPAYESALVETLFTVPAAATVARQVLPTKNAKGKNFLEQAVEENHPNIANILWKNGARAGWAERLYCWNVVNHSDYKKIRGVLTWWHAHMPQPSAKNAKILFACAILADFYWGAGTTRQATKTLLDSLASPVTSIASTLADWCTVKTVATAVGIVAIGIFKPMRYAKMLLSNDRVQLVALAALFLYMQTQNGGQEGECHPPLKCE